MLHFQLEAKEKIPIKQFSKMSLVDIMDDDRPFVIFVDNKIFFDDIYFPIREFIKYALTWLNNTNKDFIYNTIDNYENPLIAFLKEKDGWKMHSIWQTFGCDKVFSFEEVRDFINQIIFHVLE